jgi:predicted AlkP superfamily pyrophosphatase or phosphodiesterase
MVRPHESRRLRFALALALTCLFVAALAASQRPAPAADPIAILVSFDGWRSDYLDRVPAPNLRALAARGVRAKGLIPSFPSFTFPNHYTLVTGLYPDHHGIVANTIVDPAFPETFTMSADTARDSRWWGGEPIWVTANRQGRKSAAVFWPGSEAEIAGSRPTYWLPFDDAMPRDDRVQSALKLLALPDAERPAFITVYFSDVDHAGHSFGPESPELAAAAAEVPAARGLLIPGVQRLGLSARTTIVVVSDHGMAATGDERRIFLDDYVDLATVDVVEYGSLLQIAPKTGSVTSLLRRLRGAHPRLDVRAREQLPGRLHYGHHRRVTPIIGRADEGWTVTSHERVANEKPDVKPRRGAHGYDPQLPSMHGLFVAAGPRLRTGVVVAPFENIHVYDFLCRILGLTPAANDGDEAVTRGFFAVR